MVEDNEVLSKQKKGIQCKKEGRTLSVENNHSYTFKNRDGVNLWEKSLLKILTPFFSFLMTIFFYLQESAF